MTKFTKRSVFGLVAYFAMSNFAYASRTLLLPTLQISTIHGGSNSAGNICVSADMLSASSYPTSLVQLMYHQYIFTFVNISTTTQTMTLKVLPGSYFNTANSAGNAAAPVATGPSRPITTTVSIPFSLAPSQTVSIPLVFYGTSTVAAFVQGGDTAPVCDTAVGQTCLAGSSSLQIEVDVSEDRGAILASVETVASRCMGNVDKWSTVPVNKDLNGGRPF